MRRRPVELASFIPARLRVFRWQQWGPSPEVAVRAWGAARRDYFKGRPDSWPHPLAVFAGEMNVRAKLEGRAVPLPKYDEGSGPLGGNSRGETGAMPRVSRD